MIIKKLIFPKDMESTKNPMFNNLSSLDFCYLENNKNELIPFYFSQLWDENYTNWEEFIKQFDNVEWKEKNKAIIENLALALGCSFNEVTKEKISQLKNKVKDISQLIKNQEQTNNESQQKNNDLKNDKVEKIAKFVILIGKNGSSKTSLLILIKKLIKHYVDQKNCPPLKKHDDNYFTINLSLIDREINFLFQKPDSDLYLTSENMDIFDQNKELSCQVFCDNNKNNISINCISFPTSSSIDKNENEKKCKEIYEEDIKRDDYLKHTIKLISCYNILLAEQLKNECKNINVRERYNQLFSKFGIKTFGDSIGKDIYFTINEKFNRTINQLPSGFRQLFNLWRAMLESNDTIFLIDEPENSLYPLEQEKISFFFTREFEKNIKTQFLIATHSPFILKNFLNRDDAVIINVENAKNIKKDKKLLLNRDKMISYDEIIYLYYDITTSSYYISLYETMKRKFKENIGNKLLIASKLSCLYDDTYTDWNSFVEKFKDENWRNDQKNKPIVGLCNLLSCQPDETHDKINGLSNKIKSYATILRNEKHNTTGGLNALKKMTDDGLCFFLLHINFEVLKNKIYRVACIESSDKLNKMRNSNQTKIKHEDLLCLDNLTLLRNLLAHSDNELNWNIKISKNKQNNQIFENLKETKLFYASFENNFEKLLKEQIETIRTILINWEKIVKNFIE